MVMVNVDKLERGATAEAARVTIRAFLRNPLHVAAFKGDSEALRRRQEAMYKTIFDHFPGELLAARWGTPLVGVLGMTLWPDCEVGAIRGLMVLPRLLLALGELSPRLARGVRPGRSGTQRSRTGTWGPWPCCPGCRARVLGVGWCSGSATGSTRGGAWIPGDG
jgi:hypothetical protein